MVPSAQSITQWVLEMKQKRIEAPEEGCPHQNTEKRCPVQNTKEGCPVQDTEEGCSHWNTREVCPLRNIEAEGKPASKYLYPIFLSNSLSDPPIFLESSWLFSPTEQEKNHKEERRKNKKKKKKANWVYFVHIKSLQGEWETLSLEKI